MTLNTFLKYSLSRHTFINTASIFLASYSTVHFIPMKITEVSLKNVQTRHAHYFAHQRAATDNGIVHLSYVKASAALDFFDNVDPFLVSEQDPLLSNTMVLSEPLRAVLPQITHLLCQSHQKEETLAMLEKIYSKHLCEV